MKIKYEELSFYGKSRQLIEQANVIIEEYSANGYSLTLRQLYYQFVSRNYIENTDKNYKRLGETISNARRAGLIDWNAIVDRTRYLRKDPTWDSPQDIITSVSQQFRRNVWELQPFYIEVWFEKDALLGVFERAAEDYRLPLFSCRGYGSDSELWGASQRLRRQFHANKECVILHFGDHDPSGIDMTRDIEERLTLFGAEVTVKRMALNMDQVKQYNPPPNPAKEADSRFADYVAKYGEYSWELDALDPAVLVQLVNSKVKTYIKTTPWKRALEEETKQIKQLQNCSDNWQSICKMLDESQSD